MPMDEINLEDFDYSTALETFHYLDLDGKGFITKDDVFAIPGINEKHKKELWKELQMLDLDGDGTIDEHEFLVYEKKIVDFMWSYNHWFIEGFILVLVGFIVHLSALLPFYFPISKRWKTIIHFAEYHYWFLHALVAMIFMWEIWEEKAHERDIMKDLRRAAVKVAESKGVKLEFHVKAKNKST